MTKSDVDPLIVQAYKETDYCVFGDKEFILKIGHLNSDLLEAHNQHSVECSAFITAWNPYSQDFDDAQNSKLNVDLAAELTTRGLNFIDGIGQHPSGAWPGEKSFLIFGLSLESAKSLGDRYKQNGLIWSGADGVPQLIMLK
jgi:hypothetical protein